MDPESLLRWEDYSLAKDEMMAHTDVEMSPWWVVESEDKKTARINVISHLLGLDPLPRCQPSRPIMIPKRPEARGSPGHRRTPSAYVPDVAAS